jgi:hypothetical protein
MSLHELINQIDAMPNMHRQILQILHNQCPEQISGNTHGSFIDLANVSDTTIEEIRKFVSHIALTENLLSGRTFDSASASTNTNEMPR